uniref:Uncharacterized protein n=1 Tax=Ascaris lumbricoides TaxID=6252 RepID=A0A0M3HN92_ASCLU
MEEIFRHLNSSSKAEYSELIQDLTLPKKGFAGVDLVPTWGFDTERKKHCNVDIQSRRICGTTEGEILGHPERRYDLRQLAGACDEARAAEPRANTPPHKSLVSPPHATPPAQNRIKIAPSAAEISPRALTILRTLSIDRLPVTVT